MANAAYILFLGLVVSAAAIEELNPHCSRLCQNTANAEVCQGKCELSTETIHRLLGRSDPFQACLTPCRCDGLRDYFLGDDLCQPLRRVALAKNGDDCRCRRLGNTRVRRASGPTTVNPWENWCKHQCAQGLGGSACYCDIIP